MFRRQKPPFHDSQLPGRRFGLPMVGLLGYARSHDAVRIAWHAHDDYELMLLLEGATTYEFRGGPSVTLSGGHFLVVPPRTVHRGARDLRMPSVMCSIMFTPRGAQAGRYTVFTRADLKAIDRQFRRNPLTPREFRRGLRSIVTRLVEEIEAFHAGQRDAATKASLRALTCQAILDATRQLTLAPKASPTELAGAAEAYLRQHAAEPLRITDLARHLGLSRARVFELFKTATGLTPNEYLLRERINRGCELLATTEQSVTDIALTIGFSSSQYFCNVFRKYAGMRPTEYRRAYANGGQEADAAE
jgi:AraC-like DNA-binding protein